MKYKVGDKVLLYTWDELVKKYEETPSKEYIKLPMYWWDKDKDEKIPQNRIITITKVYERGDYLFEKYVIFKEVIKCSVNEYYLQQIKEELCQN